MLMKGFITGYRDDRKNLFKGSKYRWHKSPDGGATFPTSDGGWLCF